MRLKMTGMPVVDIGVHLGFATQQIFTRTFTQHFGIAPGRYRIYPGWYFSNMFPALYNLCPHPPEPDVVRLAMPHVINSSLTYRCSGSEIEIPECHGRNQKKIGDQAIMLSGKRQAFSILYSFEPVKNSCCTKLTLSLSADVQFSEYNCDGDMYLRFSFSGTPAELIRTQAEICLHILPARKEFRRSGSDVFISLPGSDSEINESCISGYYYIPVSD